MLIHPRLARNKTSQFACEERVIIATVIIVCCCWCRPTRISRFLSTCPRPNSASELIIMGWSFCEGAILWKGSPVAICRPFTIPLHPWETRAERKSRPRNRPIHYRPAAIRCVGHLNGRIYHLTWQELHAGKFKWLTQIRPLGRVQLTLVSYGPFMATQCLFESPFQASRGCIQRSFWTEDLLLLIPWCARIASQSLLEAPSGLKLKVIANFGTLHQHFQYPQTITIKSHRVLELRTYVLTTLRKTSQVGHGCMHHFHNPRRTVGAGHIFGIHFRVNNRLLIPPSLLLGWQIP